MFIFIFIVSILSWFNKPEDLEKSKLLKIIPNGFVQYSSVKYYRDFPEVTSNSINTTINVRDYGAVGDGRVDDTKAFQKAALALQGDHSILYIPDGNYRLSSKIDILKGNTKILGTGKSILQFTNENCKINNQGFCNCALGIHIGANLSNVVIDGLDVRGKTTDQIVSYGITVWDFSKNITIRNCRLEGFTGGILFNRKNRNLICENNVIKQMTYVPAVKAGGYGIVFQSSEKTIIRRSKFESSIYRHAVYYARNQRHLNEDGFDHQFYDNTVYGNTQKNYITGYELSFKILGNSGLKIERNTFIGGIGHIWLTKNKGGINPNPRDVVIKDNLFKNIIRSHSAKFYAIGMDDKAKTDNLVISNNSFENNSVDYLIKLQYGDNIVIENNVINGINEGHFLFIEYFVDNLSLLNNKISGMNEKFYGLIVGSPDGRSRFRNKTSLNMMNNSFRGCGIGILVYGPISGKIENNDIYAKVGGISLPGDQDEGMISGNKIYQSKWGIRDIERVKKKTYSKNFFNGKEIN